MLRILISLSFTICFFSFLVPSSIKAQEQLHHANQDLPCINKNYNLLAHVAVDSSDRLPLYTMQELDTMILQLNQFFSPICISFSLCEYNILENDYSLGRLPYQPITVDDQVSELKARFTLRRRINIFFLDYIHDVECGLSTFEGILTLLDANIFTERDCSDKIGEQVAHHLGHLFGLRNTFDPNTVELVDGSNCATTGDLLCDTPADPYGQHNTTPEEQILIEQGLLEDQFIGPSCEFIYEVKDPNGEYYLPDVANIMSAYPCKCGFTQDQYRLMVETILQSTAGHF